MSYEILYTAKARDDLADIYAYVAFQLGEPQTAEKLYRCIVSAVRSLETFPLRNALYENEPWHSRGLRKMPVKNYLVFYTVNEAAKRITVIRVIYGARDLDRQLFDGPLPPE